VAAARLERWRAAPLSGSDESVAAVRRHLDEDLDAPGALAALDQLAANGPVAQGAALLGVGL
jgi:hypothetical protein